eukprot:TRINITY_DN12615_c0_g1_i1.p1 TRINITY_DN12615_c0_g1~~TRINITY_DN12615_c0_g1_i1.p1  ORF type:complete len:335 (+),score=107.49 TRINITY_DN12615_c0_g1_i1:16-1020(+)
MKSLLLFFALFACSSAINITAQWGTAFQVGGNVQTQVTLGAWNGYLNILTNADANVTITPVLNLDGQVVPAGYNGLALNANSAIIFQIEPRSALVRAYLATGELSVGARVALAVTGKRPAVLYYWGNASAFIDLDITSYSVDEGIMFDLPFPGLYVIASVDVSTVNPAVLGLARRIRRAERRAIRYFTRIRDAYLDLALQTEANATLVVNEKIVTTRQLPRNLTSVNIYFDIDLTVQTNLNATIGYRWAANQFANVTDFTRRLVWAFYNEATGQWVVVKTTIDVDLRVVSAATTHFSEWGLYATNDDDSTDTDGESSSSMLLASGVVAAAAALL